MSRMANKTIRQISIGDTAHFDRLITAADVADFTRLSGDTNPLHQDDAFAKSKGFKRRIVHGMLLGALCSKLIGVYLPGRRSIYVSQDLIFKNPVYIGDIVTVGGTVKYKSTALSLIEITVEIINAGKIAAYGTAKIKLS